MVFGSPIVLLMDDADCLKVKSTGCKGCWKRVIDGMRLGVVGGSVSNDINHLHIKDLVQVHHSGFHQWILCNHLQVKTGAITGIG